MSVGTMIQRFVAPPPLNVGGGDLLSRMLATLSLLLLVVMTVPQANTHPSLLKISLLIAAELGLISVMLGLFLRSQTYFAGLQLFVSSLTMLWLTGKQVPWLATVVGVLFILAGALDIVTRRSRLNALLEVNSRRVPLEEVDDAAAATADPAGAKALAGAPLKALTHGGTR